MLELVIKDYDKECKIHNETGNGYIVKMTEIDGDVYSHIDDLLKDVYIGADPMNIITMCIDHLNGLNERMNNDSRFVSLNPAIDDKATEVICYRIKDGDSALLFVPPIIVCNLMPSPDDTDPGTNKFLEFIFSNILPILSGAKSLE